MDLQNAFDRGFEAVKTYVDAELGVLAARIATLQNDTILPPDLAAEVASAVRALHEAPQLIQANSPPVQNRVVRIERDADGNLVPIYEEPTPIDMDDQP
jgi:hypothetical protein